MLISKNYTPSEIYKLWRKTCLSIEDVADYYCRSYERARDYCYGYNMSQKIRNQIACYFRSITNEKQMAKVKK